MKSSQIILLLCLCYMTCFVSKSESLTSDSLYSVAVEYFQQEEHEKALYYLNAYAEQLKKQYGDTSLMYGNIMTECGYCCINLDRIEDAINYEMVAYNITKKMPREHIESVKNLIGYYGDSGDFEKVKVYLEELLQLNELAYETNEEIASALMEISGYYRAMNDYDEEEKAIRRAIDIDPNNDEQNMMRLFSLFECLKSSQKYNEAIFAGEKDLKMMLDYYVPTDSTFAICGVLMSNLAQCYSKIENYLKAIDFNNQAIRIFENTIGRFDIRTALTYESLADNYEKIGLFYDAIDNEKETLNILLNVVGKSDSRYAFALSNLAYYDSQIGMNIEALSLCEEAYGIIKNLEVDDDYLLITSNLADHFANLGNFDRAIELTQQVIDFRTLSKDEHAFEYATSLNNMATYIGHLENGNIKHAISLQEESIHVISGIFNESSQYYIDALTNLAVLYSKIDNYENSLSILRECQRLSDINETQNDHCKSRLYYNMGNTYYYIGEYDKAIDYLTDAHKIMVKYGQTNTIQFIQVLIGLYYSNLSKGDIEEVKYWLKEVEKNNHYQVIHCLPFLTSRERRMFWDLLSDWYQYDMPKCLQYINDGESLGEIYNAVLLSKGILLGTDIEIGEIINNNNILNQIRQERYLLENTTRNLTSIEIDSLLQSIESKEKQLLIDAGIENSLKQYYSIGYQNIGNSLDKDEIAIEFIVAQEENRDVCYALCHKHEYAFPHIIKLSNYSKLVTKETDKKMLDDIYEIIWEPLRDQISNVKNIFFAPAGNIHIIPIESAFFDNKRIGDIYNVYRLSSTRQLVDKKTESQLNSAVLYGGLSYDAKIEDVGNANSSLNMTAVTNPYMERYPFDNNESPQYLPSTKEEVEEVYNILSKTMNVSKYMNCDGTEESFKAISGQSVNLLHISTHGFFWKNEVSIKNNNLKRLVDKYAQSEDKALSRSGLYFSGVNNYLQNHDIPNNMEDGILTAHEISKIDLHNLNIVVLSACQTGLGDLKCDGVFGLQRGFKKAGAKTLLMSLWRVNDIATKLLMVEFYRNYLSGNGKQESLRLAQSYVRDYTDEKGNKLFESPYYWAGFILLDALD